MTDRFLRALVEAGGDGMFSLDRDDRYTSWNAAMERITGMRAGEVIGRRAAEAFPFLVSVGEIAFHQRALAGEACDARDRRYAIPETGHEGWYDARYLPVRDERGEVIGAVVIVTDTTERKLADARVAETERRFQNMADASPVLLWMSGTDSLCTFFNQTWLDFTGRTLEEEWGVGWAEGVHFEDLQRCLDTYERAFNARAAFEMEYRLRRADGEYRWILDRGVPRYEPDGAFAGYIGSCIDITDRRVLEAELREKVVVRDDFLGIASHELRTPLSALRLQVDGMLRLLARGADPPEEERARRWRAVQGSVYRLEGLVSRLLDVSRMRSGGPTLDPTTFDLVELTRLACERLQEELARVGSTLQLDAPAPVIGTWDRERLDQVVTNLVSNALKYGAGKPIQVQVEESNGDARVVVRDHGIGISTADQHRIFERFERTVSSRSFGGFGLGLWIAEEIVKASGGTIEVASTPGQGATFTVTLPRGAG